MTNFDVYLNSPVSSINLSKVKRVNLQTESGTIELLPNHSKLLSQITVSYLDVFVENDSKIVSYFINGGTLMFDESLHITSSEIFLADHYDKNWLESLKAKRTQVKEQMAKARRQAMSQSQFFVSTEDVDIQFLLAEERLAKIQFFEELLK